MNGKGHDSSVYVSTYQFPGGIVGDFAANIVLYICYAICIVRHDLENAGRILKTFSLNESHAHNHVCKASQFTRASHCSADRVPYMVKKDNS